MAALIIVSGLPCSGKSTLAVQLRVSLGWPLVAKDAIKEVLFDALGAGDRAWSKRLSRASYTLMFQNAHELLTAGMGCIIEGNFRWSENEEHFLGLRHGHPRAQWLQIYCDARTELLIARHRERVANDVRHAGHLDADTTQEIEAEFHQAREALPLGVPTLTFDSSVNDRHVSAELIKQVEIWARALK